MNYGNISQMTILFVDVAGSVELYDSIGDLLAHEKVVGCLNEMATIIEGHGGRVVEVIGDGIMAAFADSNRAFESSVRIQLDREEGTESPLGVRIGFHSGPTAEAEGHPFGDTVNVAARMLGLAKSGQIITNHQTVEALSTANQARTRIVDRVFIKGKPNPYTIHEVVWDESDSTVIMALPEAALSRRRTDVSLYLRYRGRELCITESSGEVLLGRGQRCGLVVQSNAVSRTHAVLSCHNGMMVLKDQSTNGTFVRAFEGERLAEGGDLFIHHEEWLSDAVGVFSLGTPIKSENPNLIYFRIG